MASPDLLHSNRGEAFYNHFQPQLESFFGLVDAEIITPNQWPMRPAVAIDATKRFLGLMGPYSVSRVYEFLKKNTQFSFERDATGRLLTQDQMNVFVLLCFANNSGVTTQPTSYNLVADMLRSQELGYVANGRLNSRVNYNHYNDFGKRMTAFLYKKGVDNHSGPSKENETENPGGLQDQNFLQVASVELTDKSWEKVPNESRARVLAEPPDVWNRARFAQCLRDDSGIDRAPQNIVRMALFVLEADVRGRRGVMPIPEVRLWRSFVVVQRYFDKFPNIEHIGQLYEAINKSREGKRA